MNLAIDTFYENQILKDDFITNETELFFETMDKKDFADLMGNIETEQDDKIVEALYFMIKSKDDVGILNAFDTIKSVLFEAQKENVELRIKQASRDYF